MGAHALGDFSSSQKCYYIQSFKSSTAGKVQVQYNLEVATNFTVIIILRFFGRF